MTPNEYAQLALAQFRFAAQLALLFTAVNVVYLFAAWQLAGRLRTGMVFTLHTLFLGWQSNVAYLACVTLLAARRAVEASDPLLPDLGWRFAPFLVPGAITLYSGMLIFCLVFYLQCAARSPGAKE